MGCIASPSSDIEVQVPSSTFGKFESTTVLLILLLIVILVPSVSAEETHITGQSQDKTHTFLRTLEPVDETVEVLKQNLISCILLAGSLITIVIGGLAYLVKACMKSFQTDFPYSKFP